MVFIQSQEYTDVFGKQCKNIIDLQGQFDYKVFYNAETGQFDVVVVAGEMEKYLYSADNEEQCFMIFRNMLNQHAKYPPTTLFDIKAFGIPIPEEEDSLEDIEETIRSVLKFYGMEELSNKWDEKVEEAIVQFESEYPEHANELRNLNNTIVDTVEPSNIITNHTNRNIHYV